MVTCVFMFPVLLTIGKTPISSFGVILLLGILMGVFLIWRLIRAWDLDEEKVLDITFLTFLGGLVGARLYFVFTHFNLFSPNIFNTFFFNRVPGFSFWGGLFFGVLSLYFLAKKKKMDFWMLSDIASIGLLAGLIFNSLGCFLGGCDVGVSTRLLVGVGMAGEIGRRFPIQILEALALLAVLVKLWSSSIHFHQRGKIFSLSLIYIGTVKMLAHPLKAKDSEYFFSVILIILGVSFFYNITKRDLGSDIRALIKFLKLFLTDLEVRKVSLARLGKYWYNQKTRLAWSLRNIKKGLRKFNVRLSYKNNQQS